ncbi:MAG: tRNA pseudouridine(55) synthase TruB [Hominenteromicrobium sp.]
MNGIIVLDKPQDFTSFDAVAVVRGLTREKRIGHTGTLDPMATGVLPLLLGCATKAAPLLPDTDKTYEASFRFGEARDTGDTTGTLLRTDDTPVTAEALRAVLPRFTGDILQVPPMYSAVSVNGQRLYKLARQGVEIEREARPVHIASLALLGYDAQTRAGRLAVTCSKGTYIRVLIEDMAAALSTCGVMTALRRTAACGFTLADAVSLDTLRALKESGDFSSVLRPVEKLFSDLPAVQVTAAQGKRYLNGGALDFARCRAPRIAMPEGGAVAVYCEARFLGLARLADGELRYVKSFSVE